MNTMHPHWQETERDPEHDEERVVPVTVKDAPQAAAKAPRTHVSRGPAALVGIVAALSIGFFSMQSLSWLQGQTTESPDVRIMQDGVQPSVITVQPGQTITWINDDEIPHILSSDNLPTTEGNVLETSAIFPGGTATVTISPTAAPGTYLYISKTSQAISGQIIVESNGRPTTATSSANSDQMTMPEVPSTFSITSAASSSTPSSAPAPATYVPPALPVNPHTVGSPVNTFAGGPTNTQGNALSTTHPNRNAETGPGLWVVIAGSILALWYATRRSFARIESIGE